MSDAPESREPESTPKADQTAEAKPAPKPAPPAKKPPESAPEFLVSSSPHLSDGETTRRVMFEVVLAMLPLFVAAIYWYRMPAVVLTVATVAGCLFSEAVANKIRGRCMSSLGDGSAIVTGVILAFSLPPSIHPYMAFIGGAVAIALGKAVFGGLGNNLFNPAMVGRAFLMMCFPAAMATWVAPVALREVGVDAVSMATPLYMAAQADGTLVSTADLFWGGVGGCVGETCALAAMVGGLYLVIRGIADWRQVVGVLGSVAIFAAITHWADPTKYPPVDFHLASGALMFGAFFIATDYVGAPVSSKGRWIFGIGVGVLVMLIRLFGTYPEGFMFAILIMNALTPLIERWTVPTPFGGKVTA